MRKLIVIFSLIVFSGVALGHHHQNPPPPPEPPVINVDVNVEDPGAGGGSGTTDRDYAPGVAIAAASGLCVKDWKPGWQKCVSWSMVDVEGDETVHGFGGGLTTRVDQFAVHVYGGFENLEGDDTTLMIGGSLNWR